jgi:hypothetical protein
MTINTVADITGDNAKHAISATANASARSLWLTAHGSSNARFGNVNVAAASGVQLTADVQSTFSANAADPTDWIDLTAAYVYVPAGTTVSITWGS